MNKDNLIEDPNIEIFEMGSLYKISYCDRIVCFSFPAKEDTLMYAGYSFDKYNEVNYNFYCLINKRPLSILWTIIERNLIRLEKI